MLNMREHIAKNHLKTISSLEILFSLYFWINEEQVNFNVEIFRHTGLIKNWPSSSKKRCYESLAHFLMVPCFVLQLSIELIELSIYVLLFWGFVGCFCANSTWPQKAARAKCTWPQRRRLSTDNGMKWKWPRTVSPLSYWFGARGK